MDVYLPKEWPVRMGAIHTTSIAPGTKLGHYLSTGNTVPLLFAHSAPRGVPQLPDIHLARQHVHLNHQFRFCLGTVDLFTDKVAIDSGVVDMKNGRLVAQPAAATSTAFNLLPKNVLQSQIGPDNLVSMADAILRATRFYEKYVPIDYREEERELFFNAEIGDGVVPQIVVDDDTGTQYSAFESEDCHVFAMVKPNQWDKVQEVQMCEIQPTDSADNLSVGFRTFQDLKHWRTHGGDENSILVQIAKDRVGVINEALEAITLAHRAVRWVHHLNPGMGLSEQKHANKASAEMAEVENMLHYNIIRAACGSFSAHPKSALSMEIYNAFTPESKRAMWAPRNRPSFAKDDTVRRIPAPVNESREGVFVDENGVRIKKLSPVMLYTPMDHLEVTGQGGTRLPCSLQIMTPKQAAEVIHHPTQYGGGSNARLDNTAYKGSNGQVPECAIVQNALLRPLQSQTNGNRYSTCGWEEHLLCTNGTGSKRRLRPCSALSPLGITTITSIPHSIAIWRSKQGNTNCSSARDAAPPRISTLFDFTCAVVEDSVYMQMDPPVHEVKNPPPGITPTSWGKEIESKREQVRGLYSDTIAALQQNPRAESNCLTPLSYVPKALTHRFSALTCDPIQQTAAFLAGSLRPIHLLRAHINGCAFEEDQEVAPQITDFTSNGLHRLMASALRQENEAIADTTYVIPDADKDALYWVVPDTTAISEQVRRTGAEFFDRLADLSEELIEASGRANPGRSYSSVKPMRHNSCLGGNAVGLTVLAAGEHGRPTFNRAAVLVHTKHPTRGMEDLKLLLVDRSSLVGTDPEYFSTDRRMATEELVAASSVKAALGQNANPLFQVCSVQRSRVSCKHRCDADGMVIDGAHFSAFAVQWKEHPRSSPTRSSFLVCCANKLRTHGDGFTNATSTYTRLVPARDPVTGDVYATLNPNWRIIHIG